MPRVLAIGDEECRPIHPCSAQPLSMCRAGRTKGPEAPPVAAAAAGRAALGCRRLLAAPVSAPCDRVQVLRQKGLPAPPS